MTAMEVGWSAARRAARWRSDMIRRLVTRLVTRGFGDRSPVAVNQESTLEARDQATGKIDEPSAHAVADAQLLARHAP